MYGFRSTFRDWAAEMTHFPRELAEKALAHVVGDETERAYQRGDLLEKRRKLMDAWAAHCGRAATPEVVPLRAGANGLSFCPGGRLGGRALRAAAGGRPSFRVPRPRATQGEHKPGAAQPGLLPCNGTTLAPAFVSAFRSPKRP